MKSNKTLVVVVMVMVVVVVMFKGLQAHLNQIVHFESMY